MASVVPFRDAAAKGIVQKRDGTTQDGDSGFYVELTSEYQSLAGGFLREASISQPVANQLEKKLHAGMTVTFTVYETIQGAQAGQLRLG